MKPSKKLATAGVIWGIVALPFLISVMLHLGTKSEEAAPAASASPADISIENDPAAAYTPIVTARGLQIMADYGFHRDLSNQYQLYFQNNDGATLACVSDSSTPSRPHNIWLEGVDGGQQMLIHMVPIEGGYGVSEMLTPQIGDYNPNDAGRRVYPHHYPFVFSSMANLVISGDISCLSDE